MGWAGDMEFIRRLRPCLAPHSLLRGKELEQGIKRDLEDQPGQCKLVLTAWISFERRILGKRLLGRRKKIGPFTTNVSPKLKDYFEELIKRNDIDVRCHSIMNEQENLPIANERENPISNGPNLLKVTWFRNAFFTLKRLVQLRFIHLKAGEGFFLSPKKKKDSSLKESRDVHRSRTGPDRTGPAWTEDRIRPRWGPRTGPAKTRTGPRPDRIWTGPILDTFEIIWVMTHEPIHYKPFSPNLTSSLILMVNMVL
ncbi:hypothetical protein Cgig2_014231 [Carnegiea gigantea]|uniref:Uncharacterized protein n=1 Tax=Carnegiea gigantea TaxID=171969 RepID=A0A9Q1QAE2_9CARY|nr:hypothetical protein Cgig2_014231 [Carnegiea gigantea]